MRIFKLRFNTPIHIGNGVLTGTSVSICADTLFSALCCEAVKIGKLDALKNGVLVLSDCFPFIDDEYYIPKPMMNLEIAEDVDKKQMRALEFISLSVLGEQIDPEFEKGIVDELWIKTVRQNLDSKGDPFFIASFHFKRGGLYFLTEGQEALMDELVHMLQFTGIGGKRSSGFGKFTYEIADAADFDFSKKSDEYVTLSTCMAKTDELENALVGAKYLLKKRGGYVASFNYADRFLKKRDFYSFASGSVFQNKFEGDIFDVSQNGNHPVWRYAKPLFLAV
ncbi:MAG: type III-A CRISPR-associated RAMP protein Csm4 [Clostridiales bacterium]|jgi:CRISPR-associated protein Csm4|nr:type III-A CRISPR-associated RAMP protein Csm4 [Clostridiales bacterium]